MRGTRLRYLPFLASQREKHTASDLLRFGTHAQHGHRAVGAVSMAVRHHRRPDRAPWPPCPGLPGPSQDWPPCPGLPGYHVPQMKIFLFSPEEARKIFELAP